MNRRKIKYAKVYGYLLDPAVIDRQAVQNGADSLVERLQYIETNFATTVGLI